MAHTVEKTILLPSDLAREVEALAAAKGKTLSAVIEDALRRKCIAHRRDELRTIQGYWTQRARDMGLLTEEDLARCLAK